MRLSGRPLLITAGTAAIVIAAGTGAWALSRSSGTANAASTTTLATATSSTVEQTVTSTGTIEPAQREDLTFSVSGTITKVSATVGAKVVKGAALATVDTTDLQSAVDQAQASVTAAQQQVTSVSGSTATQKASAAASLAAAEVTLTQTQSNLTDATLKAPFAGTVAAVGYAVGDVVGSGSSGSSGSSPSGGGTTSAITLITTDKWVVNAAVGSADLAQLAKGMQVQITPSGTTQRFFGTVSSIGIVADSSTSGSATFPVVVAVTGTPTGLYAGGTADLSFIVKQVPDVLTVPTLALHTVNGNTVVYRQANGKRVITSVTVGTSYGPTTEITSGISAGDKVEVNTGGFGGRTGNTTRRNTGEVPGGFGGGTGGFGGGTGGQNLFGGP